MALTHTNIQGDMVEGRNDGVGVFRNNDIIYRFCLSKLALRALSCPFLNNDLNRELHSTVCTV